MTFVTAILIFSSVIAIYGLYHWWRYKLSRSWPHAKAKIFETKPQSLFESEGGSLYLNLDTDFVLVYRVAGREYRKVIDIESSNIRIGGIKVWRRVRIPDDLSIRYNPNNPADFIHPSYERVWVFLFVIAGIGFAAVCIIVGFEFGSFG